MRGRTNRRGRLREGASARRPLLVIAGLFAVGTLVTWLAVTHLAYATGVAGTSGHLGVQACSWSQTGGHRYPHCHGIFRSDDGTVVDPDATIDSDLPVGSTVALRRTADHSYEQIGLDATFGWLALSLFGLVVLVLGAMAVRARAAAQGSSRALSVLLGVLVAAMLTSAFIGGVAGMAESF
ncbi:hypothetical protein [Streptomyces sp. NBC_00151]|uniref:hypothetical protein n=1 Tax=Streptomyces sp. NBC_00151 TaxID=2975669 RepID=UPI002DD7FB63|nr:hypothetical protein [Streptomyces sp. NBC_00151]WRZ39769.1 hypothetical protein OG915_17970 [Streptomyces sp. NBC_00151]